MTAPGTQAYYDLPAEQRRTDYANAVRNVVATGGDKSEVPVEAYFTPAETSWIQAAATANLAPWMNEVKSKYPAQAPYLGNPEIAALLKQAVDEKWPPDVLQSHLEASQWWKSHSPQQRQWNLLNQTDPAAALQSVQGEFDAIRSSASNLGLRLSSGDMMTLAVQSLSLGWTQQQLNEHMVSAHQGGIAGGSMGVTRDQLKSIADDYLLPASDQTLDQWTKRIAAGNTTPDVFKDQMSRQAMSRYQDPGIKEALAHGMTIKDFADPYVQMAAQTLGMNPNDIDLLQTKWSQALDHVDDKNGVRRAMTMNEWEQKIKMDPTYGYDSSKNGIAEASQLVGQLRQQFGFA